VPMPNDLRSSIEALAATFASSILAAIRGANLDDVLTVGSEPAPAAKRGRGRPRKDAAQTPAASARASTLPKRGPGRPKKTSAAAVPSVSPKKGAQGGRLARRSQAQIEKTLGDIVALVKKKPGLRAEQIRAQLGLQAKEMPRILAEGLSTKTLTKKGEKRATVYSAR